MQEIYLPQYIPPPPKSGPYKLKPPPTFRTRQDYDFGPPWRRHYTYLDPIINLPNDQISVLQDKWYNYIDTVMQQWDDLFLCKGHRAHHTFQEGYETYEAPRPTLDFTLPEDLRWRALRFGRPVIPSEKFKRAPPPGFRRRTLFDPEGYCPDWPKIHPGFAKEFRDEPMRVSRIYGRVPRPRREEGMKYFRDVAAMREWVAPAAFEERARSAGGQRDRRLWQESVWVDLPPAMVQPGWTKWQETMHIQRKVPIPYVRPWSYVMRRPDFTRPDDHHAGIRSQPPLQGRELLWWGKNVSPLADQKPYRMGGSVPWRGREREATYLRTSWRKGWWETIGPSWEGGRMWDGDERKFTIVPNYLNGLEQRWYQRWIPEGVRHYLS